MKKLKLTFIIIGSLILYAIVFVLILYGWNFVMYPIFRIVEIIINIGGGG